MLGENVHIPCEYSFFGRLFENFRQADYQQKNAEEFPQKFRIHRLRHKGTACGKYAAAQCCGPYGRKVDLFIFEMENQGAGCRREEVKQIDALSCLLLHGKDSRHPYHQQTAAANTEA